MILFTRILIILLKIMLKMFKNIFLKAGGILVSFRKFNKYLSVSVCVGCVSFCASSFVLADNSSTVSTVNSTENDLNLCENCAEKTKKIINKNKKLSEQNKNLNLEVEQYYNYYNKLKIKFQECDKERIKLLEENKKLTEDNIKLKKQKSNYKKLAQKYKTELDSKSNYVSPEVLQNEIDKAKTELLLEFNTYLKEYIKQNSSKKIKNFDTNTLFHNFVNFNINYTNNGNTEIVPNQANLNTKATVAGAAIT